MNKLPIETYDLSDPGDDMQLRIRYQHGYGLVLFCAAETGKIPCESLWFEQREDILLEKKNSRFDFYQVKTRETTLGKWKISDDAFVKSIKRFCEFDSSYNQCVDNYYFVSNCPFRESKKETKEEEQALSPVNFLRNVGGVKEYSELKDEYKTRFDKLLNSTKVDSSILLRVLKKMELVQGPPLENFDLELSGQHLRSISLLEHRNLTQINRIRDEFVQKIFNASSLNIDDAFKHIFGRIKNDSYDPRVMSKKISLDDFKDFLTHTPKDVFTYFKNSSELNIGSAGSDLNRLKKKTDRAGLGSQYESLKRRALSAEEHFLEEANKNPESFQSMMDQVEGSVLTICSDAILDATNDNKINGIQAFKSARNMLECVYKENPAQVSFQSPECLVGVAGLLTGACKLWWSEQFDMDEET